MPSASLHDLLDQHGRALHALLLKLTLRPGAAEELFQELFVRLGRSTGFASSRDPAAYAFRSAIHLAMDWRRSRRTSGASEEAIDTSTPDGLSQLVRDEEVRRALEAIDELPELTREAVCLRYLQQWDYEAVGRAIERTPHQARALCASGIATVREKLTGADERRLR
jgi:RNA polymerase sigma factor (sigma-70 family)